MSDSERPSPLWYIGHIFFWVITGLICYLVWKDRNIEAARRHLIHSIWLGIAVWVLLGILLTLVGALAAMYLVLGL